VADGDDDDEKTGVLYAAVSTVTDHTATPLPNISYGSIGSQCET